MKSEIRNEFGQALPFHKIHREILLTLMDADFVNGDDVRMQQAGRRRSLRAESHYKLRTGQRTQQQHFHRDNAAQAHLPRLINNAHPAPRDFFEQFVITEGARQWQPRRRRSGDVIARTGSCGRRCAGWINLAGVRKVVGVSCARLGKEALGTKTNPCVTGQWRGAFEARGLVSHNRCPARLITYLERFNSTTDERRWTRMPTGRKKSYGR